MLTRGINYINFKKKKKNLKIKKKLINNLKEKNKKIKLIEKFKNIMNNKQVSIEQINDPIIPA